MIATLVTVFTVSYGYSIFTQPKQTDNTIPNSPSSEPTTTPEQTTTPEPTTSSSPTEELNESTPILMPSVPEFTLRYVDNSYDVPPTCGIDQYTGKNVTTKEGYHVDKRSIEFTIKNQPFTSYNDSIGNNICVYYNFRFKGQYGEEWSYYPFEPDGRSTIPYNGYSWGTGDLSPKFPASSSASTVASIEIKILPIRSVPNGTKVEFQAQALIGHVDYESSGLLAGSYYYFIGERSGWSETKTIAIS